MPILDTLHEYMGGEHYGNYLAVCCPFHGDSHPSMLVYEDKYSCKACGAYGDTEKLLKRFQGGSLTQFYSFGIGDEKESLPNPFRVWLRSDTSSLAKVLKGAWDYANNNGHAVTYITKERGIHPKTRRALGIGVRDGFYTFPVVDSSKQIVGAFVRSGPELPASRYFVPKDQDPNLLYVPSWKALERSRVVFLTFGPIDAITLHQLGFASISTLSGKNLDTSALDDIRKKIVILPDYLEDREASRMAAKLGWRGEVFDFPYPDGTKDLNEVYRDQPSLIAETLQERYGDQLEGRIGSCQWSNLTAAIIGVGSSS